MFAHATILTANARWVKAAIAPITFSPTTPTGHDAMQNNSKLTDAELAALFDEKLSTGERKETQMTRAGMSSFFKAISITCLNHPKTWQVMISDMRELCAQCDSNDPHSLVCHLNEHGYHGVLSQQFIDEYIKQPELA